jgi:hypothetical protein
MSGEVRLIDGDVFDAGALAVAEAIDDAVNHEEGVAVREDFQDLIDIEDAFAVWD